VKLLVDNQLPIGLARWLTTQGLDARHVVDEDLGSATDHQIWTFARERNLVIVSKDDDFRIIANQQRSIPPQLVWVRLGNCRKMALIAAFESILPRLVETLGAGEAIVEIR
jgi:predicted nuclease of predicted toxin-antitoxin system